MRYYADSSFLVSCYLVDANTPLARNWLSWANVVLPFNALHALEVPNAVRLGVFRRSLTRWQADAVLADLRSDLAAGRLVTTPVNWPSVFRAAARLSEDQTAKLGSRSLDILHLGAAKVLRSTDILSFDTRQRMLATTAGLNTLP